MNAQKRKQQILEKITSDGEVEIKQLAAVLNTAEITIRRDLNQLSEDGLLYRTHGGAMKVNPLEFPHHFMNKAAVNSEAKDKIARRAAAEIRDGDIIFLDCGSTVFRLCPFIKNKKIKVITNSIPVVYELRDSLAAINIIGGEFDPERQAVHGKMAEYHIKKYRASKAFLGVDGISPNGLFANSEKEASMTMALAAQSSFTYLLCDASKIGKETYLRFADIGLANALVTDHNTANLKYLKKAGVTTINAR
jgi:DeoR family transcriptional regulator, fructose operon transcriptional repressor